MVTRINRSRNAGFTLIELLVVISIIGVLSSLILAAVMKVRNLGNETKAKSAIRQLDTDINAYKAARHIDHLPAFGGGANGAFRLRPTYNAGPETTANASQQSIEWQYLSRIFPGLSPAATGLPTLDLDNNQVMVFFLTGGEVTQYSGFSNDAARPFDTSAASQANRKGKYFDIPNDRLQKNAAGARTGRYLDPWDTPYVYLAPVDGKQYPMPTAAGDVVPQAVLQAMMLNPTPAQPTGLNPYRSLVSGTNTKALKDGSFQIISAGPNKLFGRGSYFVNAASLMPFNPPAFPAGNDVGADDFANFHDLKLSAPGN